MGDGGPLAELTPDLALAPVRFPCTLEKWYLDALLEDGTVLLVYFGRLALLGARWSRATADLFFPDGRVARWSAAVAAPRGGGDQLRFGESGLDGERLTLALGDLRGELRYRALAPAPRLPSPFVAADARVLRWSVEVPDAEVEGRLAWRGGALQVRGRGYRDRVYLDLPLWRFPVRRLRWGRAAAGPHAAFWVRTELASGAAQTFAWLDGIRVPEAAGAPPGGVVLGPSRTLLDLEVVDQEGLRLGPARPLLRRLTGAPREVKWAAPCTVLGAPGRAIHEEVRWTAA